MINIKINNYTPGENNRDIGNSDYNDNEDHDDDDDINADDDVYSISHCSQRP